MSVKNREQISIHLLEVGKAYEVASRNIRIGIWDGTSFHGIRRKFSDEFMDSETHYDLDTSHGTAVAIRELS